MRSNHPPSHHNQSSPLPCLRQVNRQVDASFSQYAVSSTQEYVDLGIPKLEIGTVTPDQVKEWLEKFKD